LTAPASPSPWQAQRRRRLAAKRRHAFRAWQAARQQRGAAALPLRGAFNLSGKQFDRHTLAVLNCGLKFIPTPQAPTAAEEWQAALQRFVRSVRLRCQFGDSGRDWVPRYHVPNPAFQPAPAPAVVEAFLQELHTAVTLYYRQQQPRLCSRPPPSNLTAPQRHALRALRADDSIIIKPADKNLGLVILNKCWYVAEGQKQLADAATYRVVPAAEVAAVLPSLQQQLLGVLGTHGAALPPQVHRFMSATVATYTTLPCLYLLPKIHKMQQVTPAHLHQLKGRPIVASHSWVTTPASIWLADVLNSACTEAFPQVLPDSRALIHQLEAVHVARDSLLVTFDVQSMYPSVDIPLAITACTSIFSGLRGVTHMLGGRDM